MITDAGPVLILAPVGRAPNGKLDYKALKALAVEQLGAAAKT